ncbi:MAG: 3-methyl-2-oxobutanoate dehydrogenase subunit VorB [Anaerolineae bacterium]|nr:3-methyl-2-oxobutanoate dehydrogenase subunit VorB [Anaerolineae bacterium]NIO00069.1 3-methyl-2-oxobutanoate dehydrogenase subunit VorB [Anaerolineae bacterium]NIQ82853.1 3-methyl-2-oxobutanoate dehydrogenase subunit VorB [Anaerolineae bacterium]
MARVLMKGNEAIAEAAIRAGCDAYFGYPITPQTELLEYMSKRMPELGRVFVQGESEVASINMVLGAAAAGKRAMTSSSSPGISLKQEGVSYLAGTELPAVIVNIMRGGPGLGNVQPSQSDYFQATKGGGHGDYFPIVLAPSTVQEAIDFTILAFELADKYNNPAMILGDGSIGQIMEPVELPEVEPKPPAKPWALTGCKDRQKNIIRSLYLLAGPLEARNIILQKKYRQIEANEQRHTGYMLEGAEVIIVAYGTAGRVAQTAIKKARDEGIPAGLFRPITLYPYPRDALSALVDQANVFLVLEMSAGQMLEDVELVVRGRVPVEFQGWLGGRVPTPTEVLENIHEMAEKHAK